MVTNEPSANSDLYFLPYKIANGGIKFQEEFVMARTVTDFVVHGIASLLD